MKLVGNLKKQVEETTNKEEAKEVIEKAGMELTDEELDKVAGGGDGYNYDFCEWGPNNTHEWFTNENGQLECKHCGLYKN